MNRAQSTFVKHSLNELHGDSKTRLYNIWTKMRVRCMDLKYPVRRYYYDKGITVCNEWAHCYLAFKDWALSHGYADNLSLDRIDGNKGYYPENCRWATPEEQANNKSSNVNLTLNGKTQSISRWSRELGIPISTIQQRIALGWNDEKVLTQPIQVHHHKKKGGKKHEVH